MNLTKKTHSNTFQVTLSFEKRRNISITLNLFNMTTLQDTFPFINWRDYINWNLNNVEILEENEQVIVPDVNYLHQLSTLLQTTPKRTVANYFGWRLVLFSSELSNDALHQRQRQYLRESTGTLISDSRLTECIKKTTD